MSIRRAKKWITRVRMMKSRCNSRIAVFHHLPKCAGTSLVDTLGHYFRIVRDYRRPGSAAGAAGYSEPVDLTSLSGKDLLCGHFEFPGVHLFERYPAVFEDPDHFFLFTFVRDPLELKCSLLRYEAAEVTIDHLLERPNYLASCMGIDGGNLEEVLDRYDLIGAVESLESDLPLLLGLLGFSADLQTKLPRLNQTGRSRIELSDREMEQFRAANFLDYRIYHRAVSALPTS